MAERSYCSKTVRPIAYHAASGKMPAYFLSGSRLWGLNSPSEVRCPAVSGGGTNDQELGVMKADIHPKYDAVTATCSCGNTIQTRSTRCEDFHIDVCSQCHPFYTGKQKIVDSGGRVDRFNKRFGGRGTKR